VQRSFGGLKTSHLLFLRIILLRLRKVLVTNLGVLEKDLHLPQIATPEAFKAVVVFSGLKVVFNVLRMAAIRDQRVQERRLALPVLKVAFSHHRVVSSVRI
jgi:hypothetical protein